MTSTILRPSPARPRDIVEKEIEIARQEVEIAKEDLADAQQELDQLEDELAALPPEGIDEELWYARYDPRQIDLFPTRGPLA